MLSISVDEVVAEVGDGVDDHLRGRRMRWYIPAMWLAIASRWEKFIHAISPTPSSTMSASEIRARPPNTTVSPFMAAQKTNSATETIKRPANSDSDAQYRRYDVSQKRQRQGGADGERLFFKFTSTGSCPRGEKCSCEMEAKSPVWCIFMRLIYSLGVLMMPPM